MNTEIILALAGGLLVGVGAGAMMLLRGQIAGVSGIFGGLLNVKAGDIGWRAYFVAGLVVGGTLMYLLRPDLFTMDIDRSMVAVAIGGLLVGFGARLGSGCTSGHGVCGIARFGPRSIVATLTFIASGAVVTFVVNRFFGGAI